jgi:hypothetical protein
VDAQFLGHIPCAGRHQAGRQQRVTSLGRRGERVEPRGDQLGREPERVLRRRRLHAGHHRAHRRAERYQRHADTGQQRRELLIRRRAHPHLHTEFLQPHRESRQRFDVPARPHVDNTTRTL